MTFQKNTKIWVFLQDSFYTAVNLISILLLVKIGEEEESLYKLTSKEVECFSKACSNVKCFA